jgi:uncharacterized protein YutE (UPF0331/DUF86 family)
MVDQHALSSRLSALSGYLAELRPFAEVSREDFVRNPSRHHLAERLLHLACECVIDTAHHLISDQGYRQPTSYKDAIVVLREESVLDDSLAEKLQEWMGFRNVLVHFYIDIDHGESYESIRKDLGDLEAFARAMAQFLDE